MRPPVVVRGPNEVQTQTKQREQPADDERVPVVVLEVDTTPIDEGPLQHDDKHRAAYDPHQRPDALSIRHHGEGDHGEEAHPHEHLLDDAFALVARRVEGQHPHDDHGYASLREDVIPYGHHFLGSKAPESARTHMVESADDPDASEVGCLKVCLAVECRPHGEDDRKVGQYEEDALDGLEMRGDGGAVPHLLCLLM